LIHSIIRSSIIRSSIHRAAGLIAMSTDQYHTLTVTPLGRAVMAGSVEDVRMLVPEAARRTVARSRRRMPRRSRG
jgi:hypothetical protein